VATSPSSRFNPSNRNHWTRRTLRRFYICLNDRYIELAQGSVLTFEEDLPNHYPKMNILVVYYSMYGHVLQLARAVEQGAKSVAGVDVLLRRVAEFDEVIKKTADQEYIVKVREQQADIPVCTLDDLRGADGVIFGSPTRYGNMTAQMKQLIDSTASLWLKGEMEGKPAGVFTSTGSTHGGQETTLLTMMVPLIHLGMIIVGVPYSTEGCFTPRHAAGRLMVQRPSQADAVNCSRRRKTLPLQAFSASALPR
jgi:NAD(P)H dehydrogenase (quinone)